MSLSKPPLSFPNEYPIKNYHDEDEADEDEEIVVEDVVGVRVGVAVIGRLGIKRVGGRCESGWREENA